MRWFLRAVAAGLFAGFAAPAIALDPEPAPAVGLAIPDLEPGWPGHDGATTPGYLRVKFPDGRLGTIRGVDAPFGLVQGLVRNPEAAASIGELFGSVASEPIRNIRFEGLGSFGFRPATEAERPRRSSASLPSLCLEYVSGRVEGHAPEADVLVQRTWFAVFEPADPEKLRGSVLLMPGLFGTPEPVLNTMLARLTDEGFIVVRMMAQPSRFTEQMHWVIDLEADHALPGAGMRSIVRDTTDRVAECAYAASAAMQHVVEVHPALAELPRIAVGMSGGAMTLPTVLTLEPEKYGAAIMIAGGADFFTMNIQSNYQQMINAVQFTWRPGPPDEAQLAALRTAYLSQSPLDSYHTARRLRGKPMLMIHGSHDMAVPAHLGDLLWERLGKPERWVEEAGHEEVFMRLPGRIGDIMMWLNEHVPARGD